MKLTVKTRHEPTERGKQMLAEYVARTDRQAIEASERYELTEAGKELLTRLRADD